MMRVVMGISGVLAGCGSGFQVPGNLEACQWTTDQLEVGGEDSAVDGPVTVVVNETDGRVALSITTALGDAHVAAFAIEGAPLDTMVGDVTAEVGQVFAGEGSEYGYIRLTDARGVWFEGGRSGSIDGNAQGGSAINGPFELGDDAGNSCRLNGNNSYTVALHEVATTLTEGRWRGVDVQVVAIRAGRGVYVESADTADGLGTGEHDVIDLVAYLYRVAPTP